MLKKEVKKCAVTKYICENKRDILIGLSIGLITGAVAYLLTSED